MKYGIDPQEAALKRGEMPTEDKWGRESESKWGTVYSPSGDSAVAETIPTLPGDYRLFYANVHDTILGKASIEVTHEQMLDAMYALELARESSRRGCTLEWARG
jgi:scyllo-inositol 2-dehydrogenase (NADP+)